ncbi:hypothetical protein ACFL4N_06455 [Thermodesulfobacteriota bacterium]
MKTVRGYHGEWNMGSPGGWDYQRIAQVLGKKAWELVLENTEVDVDIDFDHPQINAVPGFARMILRAHKNKHGRNPAHFVLLAESETLDVVLENKNFVEYLNNMDGVRASLAGPEHLSLKEGRVCCRGEEATCIFMDFNLNVLIEIGKGEDISPIKEAIRQGILVNPKGMEPLGAKSMFETLTSGKREDLSEETTGHTPWTRQFSPRSTTDPQGKPIEDLVKWTEQSWDKVVLKPAHGYSGHGIFTPQSPGNPGDHIQTALDAGDYIVQQFVPLGVWTEQSAWSSDEEEKLFLKPWQTDFRCFITDEGLQGFLARFGGVPTNVGSGGGIQPIAILKNNMPVRDAVDRINEGLLNLGYAAFCQIQEEVNQRAVDMGFTYLLGPIMITLRPRVLTENHLQELKRYAKHLWLDALALEELWRAGELDQVIQIGEEERELAMVQPWRGSPALMVSDGLFSFGADIPDKG